MTDVPTYCKSEFAWHQTDQQFAITRRVNARRDRYATVR